MRGSDVTFLFVELTSRALIQIGEKNMRNRSCERQPAFHLKRWLDASSVGVTDHVVVIIGRKTLKSARVGMNFE